MDLDTSASDYYTDCPETSDIDTDDDEIYQEDVLGIFYDLFWSKLQIFCTFFNLFKGIQLKDIWDEMLGGIVEDDGLDRTSKEKIPWKKMNIGDETQQRNRLNFTEVRS